MKRTLVIVVAVLVLGTGTVTAGASGDLVVAGGPRERQRLGPYRYGLTPTYRAAVRALGAPSAQVGTGSSCAARWAGRGLSIVFAGTASAPCDGGAVWAGAVVRAGAWRTNVGLRLGDTLATLRRLYPHALRSGSAAWLLVYRRGEVGVTVYLKADVVAGRVATFRLPLPLESVKR